MRIVYHNKGRTDSGVIQVWFLDPVHGGFYHDRLGTFGSNFIQWLDNQQIENKITESSSGHVVCRIMDDEQFVWLKLCIDEHNIRNIIDEFINKRLSEELIQERKQYELSTNGY